MDRFVGIDVAKSTLDLAIEPGGETWTVTNDAAGFQDLVSRLSRVHVEQYYPTQSASGYSTRLFRVFIVIMANALIATVILGIILAFRTSRNKWPVWLSLALGITLPVILLWLGQKHD